MKRKNNSLFLSMLLSMNKSDEHEVTYQDLRYMHCPEVSSCQIKMYSLVIECLSKGMNYEEIYSFIDNIDIKEYKKLDEEARNYVKLRVKKDLDSRKNNEQKNRGVIR